MKRYYYAKKGEAKKKATMEATIPPRPGTGSKCINTVVLSGFGRTLATFFVMNRSADSVVLLRNMIETFSGASKIVALKNLSLCDADPFVRWNASKARAAFLRNYGKEMDFAKRLTLRRWLRNFAAFDTRGDTIGIRKR